MSNAVVKRPDEPAWQQSPASRGNLFRPTEHQNLVGVQLACHANNIGSFRKEELLERRAVRHWCIRRGDAANRSIEVFKRLFGNDSSQFARKTSNPGVLVEEDNFVRLADGIENSLLIERQQ